MSADTPRGIQPLFPSLPATLLKGMKTESTDTKLPLPSPLTKKDVFSVAAAAPGVKRTADQANETSEKKMKLLPCGLSMISLSLSL